MPEYRVFREAGVARLEPAGGERPVIMLGGFRADPLAHPLATPSGRIEVSSETIAAHGYDDCPGMPVWREPVDWLDGALAARFPLHLISDQPAVRLHSQIDHSTLSRAGKVADREPIDLHPQDAAVRGIADGDVVRVFNDRSACLAGARLTDAIRPRASRSCRPAPGGTRADPRCSTCTATATC